MTNDPHSPDLDQIKSLLAKSFDASEGDDVPPLPESLRDRINGQYGRTQAHRTASSGGFLRPSRDGSPNPPSPEPASPSF
jgi:hypothetical protein